MTMRLRFWFTASELASEELPGLPDTRGGCSMFIQRLRRTTRGALFIRESVGRSGRPALECHSTLLPREAWAVLKTRPVAMEPPATAIPPAARYREWFAVADLLALRLPGVPRSAPSCRRFIQRIRDSRPHLARYRNGAHATSEVHVDALPAEARALLAPPRSLFD